MILEVCLLYFFERFLLPVFSSRRKGWSDQQRCWPVLWMCKENAKAIGISFRTKRVLILYKSPSSIPEYITSQLNHCSSQSFRPEWWFLNAGTLVTFIVKKNIIIMNYNIYMKTSYCRNKPRITVYFPCQKFPLNPLFPPLACHLSWSLLESVKMHCTVFLRLSHVSLPLMQAIKPAGFFSLTKIQSD